MKETDLFKLDEYFAPEDLEWRVQSEGVSESSEKPWAHVLAYVTSRAVQNRLDSVCGKGGWTSEIRKLDGGAYTCRLSIWVESVDKDNGQVIQGTGRWVTKEDGADETNIEATKGGISGAVKRAAVQWGIGRYLYDFGESWAMFGDKGSCKFSFKDAKNKQTYYWNPPAIPAWALPENQKKRERRLVSQINEYIKDNTLTGKNKVRAEEYMSGRNIDGMESVLDYCFGLKNAFDNKESKTA